MGTPIPYAKCIYHKEYAGPEGRRIDPESAGGETLESLAARGWVDRPWKLEPEFQRKIKSGEEVAFKELAKHQIESEQKKLEKLKAEIAKAKAEAEALKAFDENIRTKETVAEKKKQAEEWEMDEFQDSGAFQNEFLQSHKRKKESDIKEYDKAKRHPKTKKTQVVVPEGVAVN